jgi:hypothetical protein
MLEITIKPRSQAHLDAIPALLPHLAAFLEEGVTQAPHPSSAPQAAPAPKKSRTPKTESAPAAAAEAQPDPIPAGAEVTLMDLRARLAEISKAGKTDAVKALVNKYGGQKLTDVPAESYGDLLAEAEAL